MTLSHICFKMRYGLWWSSCVRISAAWPVIVWRSLSVRSFLFHLKLIHNVRVKNWCFISILPSWCLVWWTLVAKFIFAPIAWTFIFARKVFSCFFSLPSIFLSGVVQAILFLSLEVFQLIIYAVKHSILAVGHVLILVDNDLPILLKRLWILVQLVWYRIIWQFLQTVELAWTLAVIFLRNFDLSLNLTSMWFSILLPFD